MSIKNVKIVDEKAVAKFNYNKAKYDIKFTFEGDELVMLTT